MAGVSTESELLREAWSAMEIASEEMIRMHKDNMPVFPGRPGHDEWESCGCDVATAIRNLKMVESKLYVELERRGSFV